MEALILSILSVLLVSAVSLVGLLTLSISQKNIKEIILFLVSFAAGALLGDAFIHLIPELVEDAGFGISASIYILSGIVFSFIIEKIIHWRHCHYAGVDKEHDHHLAYMNLFGDGVHNFIDGMIIAGSFIAGKEVGIATTIAVLLHEIPQEIGDFAILIHGGFSRMKAIAYNFITALFAVIGAIFVFLIGSWVETISQFLIGFAAGAFIYIASTDLIPELHKEVKASKSVMQVISFVLGISVMMLLLLLEH